MQYDSAGPTHQEYKRRFLDMWTRLRDVWVKYFVAEPMPADVAVTISKLEAERVMPPRDRHTVTFCKMAYAPLRHYRQLHPAHLDIRQFKRVTLMPAPPQLAPRGS